MPQGCFVKGSRERVDGCYEHGDMGRKPVRDINGELKIAVVGTVLEPGQFIVGERDAWCAASRPKCEGVVHPGTAADLVFREAFVASRSAVLEGEIP